MDPTLLPKNALNFKHGCKVLHQSLNFLINEIFGAKLFFKA